MRNKRIFILMIGLVLFISLMGFTLNRDRLTWPEKFVGDAFGTVQGLLYRPVGAVAEFVRDLGRLSDVYKENERLRRTVARYAQDQVRYNALESRLKRLEELLKFTERQRNADNYTYLIAQVVSGNSSNPYERSVRIDLGAADGVKQNMAVVTIDGLIGLVSQVSQFTSTVTLITNLDENTSSGTPVSVTVLGKESESFGILEYNEETSMLLMSKIDEADPIADNDTIVTSGISTVFPPNLIVGTVQSNQVGDFGLTRTAVIKPAAKFDHLREVFVVVPPTEPGS